MKKSTVTLSLLFIVSLAFSQTVEISEAPRSKDNGTYNSFLFELPDVDKKQAEKDWKRFMKSFKGSKTKYNRKTKLFFTDNAKMPRLSTTAVDVYARIMEDSNPNKKTTVIVWFDLGEHYLSPESDSLKVTYVSDILTEYAMTTSKHHAESIVKREEKRLADLEKELKKLKKDNDSYHKAIEKAKETIAKNEKNIEINELDQENKLKEIAAQKETIEAAKEQVKKFIQ